MIDDAVDKLPWREFQRRWPSVSARYKRDLLGLIDKGCIGIAQLTDFREGAQKYALSFSIWGGAQRIFPQAEQIVFQINAPGIYAAWTARGGVDAQLIALLKQKSLSFWHPVDEHTVGWLRVHVDDLCRLGFVDEVQSDVLEELRMVEGDALRKAADRLAAELADWHFHGFSVVRRWCAEIGYRVGMHSKESAASVPGKTNSERKWNVYYASLIKRFGLREADFPAYPSKIFSGE